MSVKSNKGPIIDPAICRCCGSTRKCRLLNFEYEHLGKKEVYLDMIMDSFGLVLSNIDGEEVDRCVCAACVVRLRDASELRTQILRCEEALLLRLHCDAPDKPESAVKIEVKLEENDVTIEAAGIEECRGDGAAHSDDNISLDEVPLQRLKTEIPKKKTKKLKTVSRKKSEHLKMKNELLNRIKKYQMMLDQKLKPPAPPRKRLRQAAQQVSKPQKLLPFKYNEERMVYHNTVTIVENSFVCPFKNRISNYYCFYCKNIFTDTNELREHTWNHNPKMFELAMESKRIPKIDITRIDCRLCPEIITSIDDLKSHLASVHNKTIYPSKSNEFIRFKLTNDNVKCLECDESFTFVDKLIEHLIEHYGKYICDTCGGCFIEEAALLQHMRRHKMIETQFPCEVCGKNFKSNYSRVLHIATVHEKRPVVHCYKCEASFLSYAQRNRHLINVHGDNRKFPCKSCDKVFDVRKSMVEHMRKNHKQVCRHQCDICHHRFYSPSQLKEHKASHTHERNYKCDFCDKSYPRKQSLQDHMRSHSGDKSYKCELCSCTFAQNCSLRSHMKSEHQMFEFQTGFMAT